MTHHVEAYVLARQEVDEAIAALRLEIAGSIVDDVRAKVTRAMTAAFNLGFIDGIKTHDEFEAQVAADKARYGDE